MKADLLTLLTTSTPTNVLPTILITASKIL